MEKKKLIGPKVFYRRLDNALSRIGKVKSDKNYFTNILAEFKQEFDKDLKIKRTYIYEQRDTDYVLIHSLDTGEKRQVKKSIPQDSEIIRLVLKMSRLILTSKKYISEFGLDNSNERISLAVTTVHNPVKRWLFVFELQSGWVYEQVMLFLRAMRTALNYRLFSEMVGGDLKQAEQIQKSLLPKLAPDIKGYQISGRSQPAELVGGDFYEYFQFDKQDFGIALGDASGHGLPAALLVRDVVIGLRMGLEKEMRLVYTLKKLNKVIQKSTYSTNFVSLFIGEFEQVGHLFYVNAGHPPPFVVDDNSIHDLQATGITLGFLPSIDLGRAYFRLKPGAVLVAYSDGIIERVRKEEEQFGIERLKKLVLENREKSSDEIVDLIFKTVYDFGRKKSWDDDATLVVVKRLNEKSSE